jgi:hypothetical protein
VLARERIAALSVVEEPSDRASSENLALALQNEPATEQMPEVAPLSPAVAMVASRQSDVSELVSRFQIAPNEPEQDFCRALKEMAELDLTPGPFAALVREVAR